MISVLISTDWSMLFDKHLPGAFLLKLCATKTLGMSNQKLETLHQGEQDVLGEVDANMNATWELREWN